MKLCMAKGRSAYRLHHNARATGIQVAQAERTGTAHNFFRSVLGGYSGWIRSWSKWKSSAFAERILTPYVPGGLRDLPVRHPHIRVKGLSHA